MADFLVTGSTGSNVAFDELTGALFVSRTKLIHGADGVNDGDISTANPLPTRLYVGTTALSAGAGAVGTGVLRMTLASDDPAVVALQALDNIVSGTGINISQINAVAPSMGNGASGTGVLRVTLANDSTGIVALTTSTASIGKLAVNAGVTIGAVEIAAAQTLSTVTTVGTVSSVSAVIPGTGATNLGKAVDSVAGATDTGVVSLVVRDDVLTTLTPLDADYTVLRVDSTGQLWVNLGGLNVYTTDAVAPASPTGIAMLVQRDDALTTLTPVDADWGGPLRVDSVGALWVRDRLQLVDDSAFSVAASFVAPAGFLADETAPDSVDEGDVGAARMTLDRKVRTISELDSTAIKAGLSSRTPVFVVIDHATSGDNTIVASLGGALKIRVLHFCLVSAGAMTVRFESGASGTALTGQMTVASGTVINSGFSPIGHFETAAATLLNLELSAATSADGWLVYIPVD